jgi:hypothetical protein
MDVYACVRLLTFLSLVLFLVPSSIPAFKQNAKYSINDTYLFWNKVVSTHVHLGQLEGIDLHVVDYEGISKDPNFASYLDGVKSANTTGFDRNDLYAFFMNAYNAFAIKMIIEHPCKKSLILRHCEPIVSIKDIGTLLKSVWIMPAGEIAGKMYSLNDIEDYLRKPAPFQEDPRVHSCIVCASISCPNVAMSAFTPWDLDVQMSSQMKDFLSNTKKGAAYIPSSNALTLSKIFHWYGGDFDNGGGVLKSIQPYLPPSIAPHVQGGNVSLEYFDYNWNANGKSPCNCTPPMDL